MIDQTTNEGIASRVIAANATPFRQTIVSWFACISAMAVCGGLANWLPADADRYRQVASDFKLKLPAATDLVLQIPNAAIWIAGAFTVGGLLVVQVLLPSKRDATLVHLLLLAGWSLAGVIHSYALSHVFWSITFGMTGGGR